MNTKIIRDLLEALDNERKALSELETVLRTLQCKAGQAEAHLQICGLRFQLTALSRESFYQPVAMKATEDIRQAAIKLTEVRIAAQKSKVEGCEFKLQKAIKL